MRIPLDYYRILGVPIQAAAQQLSQAYHDRALQLPRREYSDLAINTRKQLLDEAYTILSDAQRRSEYDQTFLQVAPPDPSGATTGPTLDIHPEQFIGALLLLYELGEYELVLHLSEPLLQADAVLVPEQMQLVNNPLSRADIVLTVALSCLELGREQWQQGQSDRAAQTGHYGQELLLKEGLFPGIRGELRVDMFKLRPYRILELLTHDESEAELRQKGIRILQDMLGERGGIEGQGDDQSGLNLDDFLRFIQQIRNHLTTAEQQELFGIEAQRPSAVGTYLLAYAKIAHGFAYAQPPAIAQAQNLLKRLGRHQDVHLEQAVCALLLGQTEAAGRLVERSQEYEPLAFIREQSQNAPDLLPGLCLYGERWLQTEVFPHFRDTAHRTLSLKDYFANETVQGHIEQLATGHPRPPVQAAAAAESAVPSPAPTSVQAAQTTTLQLQSPPASTNAAEIPPTSAPAAIAATESSGSETEIPTTQTPEGAVALADPPIEPVPEQPPEPTPPDLTPAEDLPVAARSRSRSLRQSQIQRTRWILMGIAGIFALVSVGFLFSQIAQLLGGSRAPETAIETEPPETEVPETPEVETPPAALPPESQSSAPAPIETPAPVIATNDPLDELLAEKVVQTWLAVKALALGPEYESEQLSLILAEPALSTWQQLANDLRLENTYRDYEHSVEVETITTDGNNPDSALIEAAVREQATPYRNGQPEPGGSYDDNLRVRYELIRQGDQWLIRDMQVLQ
ncbi:MAG: DUF4101 domain-containing protein [Spirulina sp. SIO3F2]|nr:DUF4101 domain-containing protein [Spirulina sp. SIO3F2]